MNGVVDGIDQGVWFFQAQVGNLIDLFKSISKTQEHQSPICQILIFDDMNENVTFYQTSKQEFNVMSPILRACNLVIIGSKPNKKTTHKKMHIFGRYPSIIGTIIYIYIYCQRNGDAEFGNDMKHCKRH
jgi:hypothetical protein